MPYSFNFLLEEAGITVLLFLFVCRMSINMYDPLVYRKP